MPDTSIKAGDRVRSYDFPDDKDNYVEGVVEDMNGDDPFPAEVHLKVRVEKSVWCGTERPLPEDLRYVYPPRNGVPIWGGRVTNGVEKI